LQDNGLNFYPIKSPDFFKKPQQLPLNKQIKAKFYFPIPWD